MSDPEWFKTATFYEVMVRSFADSNGDGIGDFQGLIGKLDYLQTLGVDCLWLPPFFTSPLADGGYDVSDYTTVLPELGTVADFEELVAGLHARGMRVITDFVMNHTSSAHPWFVASRSDRSGPYGDYYVWRDQPDAYSDARVIFLDTHDSNWSFDEVRGQYYWHRFYDHQPDLNFENPKVLEELLDAMRFWLDKGIDGFRLDAVPYLIEVDGTNCENLPGTHAVLKEVRRMIDAEYPDRALLCEANQWPADVIEYFGEDDECQMAFHFPVMPRLYMGIAKESRVPISEILAATPAIPPGCQWGTFLRNHDELTLEMVTPQERDFMWGHYAPDPRMKSNLGIRRRLAPLVDGDQRRIRLLHSLLFALPGSPVLYYGDEIGMGDDIWLNDRDGVRTPMQWDGSPSAGFSTADPADFYLPLVTLAGYTPAEVNVADQTNDPQSLLNWVRAVLQLRRSLAVLDLGEFSDLSGDNDAVFSFARLDDQMRIVAINNLSASEQVTQIPELSGQVIHGRALISGDQVKLGPYGFVWLLSRQDPT